jgi:pantetheine-phosphate adenylyltransferase
MDKRFDLVATGGTFDEIHAGHLALLCKAFELSHSVIIGVTSDQFAIKRKGKNNINHRYEERVANLRDVDALVASTETAKKGDEINRIRHTKNLAPIAVVMVDLVRAYDDKPISSSRIRTGEIDASGKKLKTM